MEVAFWVGGDRMGASEALEELAMAMTLDGARVLGSFSDTRMKAPLGTWLSVAGPEDGLRWDVEEGTLSPHGYLCFDALLDDTNIAVFEFRLHEDSGAVFSLRFGLLPQCQARVVLPLSATDQNQWMFPREGAFLKPLCGGARVDPCRVTRVDLVLTRHAGNPVRLCMGELTLSDAEPERLHKPLLPKGPLVDPMGQYTLRTWKGKTPSVEALTKRLNQQAADAAQEKWSATFGRYGGSTALPQLEATGFFRTQHHGSRWWLVDPEGRPFWSAGMDCVNMRTEAKIDGIEAACAWLPAEGSEFAAARGERAGGKTVNYLVSNFIRGFGAEYVQKWQAITLAQLRAFGFNTVANWSDWKMAAAAGFPYVRPLEMRLPNTGRVYRDFPDVFAPGFEKDAAAFAEQLKETADDPALIGYFLMNEPTWGFAQETPAAGMLYNAPSCETRKHLAEFLRQRHGTDAKLSAAWGTDTTFIALAHNPFAAALNQAAQEDLAAFSTVMVEKFFGTLSTACRAVDANHLNLGARYHTVPPAWALAGMTSFDVFSLNAYKTKPDGDAMSRIATQLQRPVMIGEFHHGALDAGPPASGIGRVKTQTDRGRAYRYYVESAAAHPACVGAHYFQLYDQSALGRFDGENYQIGFLDVTNRPYAEMAAAARTTHERLYDVAAAKVKAFEDPPEYLPLLFI